MEYCKKMAGISYDSLIGGVTIAQVTENVSIGSGEIQRGMLLSNSDGEWKPAVGSDVNKPLAIARFDVASIEERVTSVYKSGQFNRNAIVVGSSVDLDDFEEPLRKEGIFLTETREGY